MFTDIYFEIALLALFAPFFFGSSSFGNRRLLRNRLCVEVAIPGKPVGQFYREILSHA
jgi:hypothetical protein